MIRVAGAWLLLLTGATLDAQRYRVVVGVPGAAETSVVEFRPCIPVEGSDCGAWIDKAAEAQPISSSVPPAIQSGTTADGHFSVAIRDGAVMIAPLTGKDRGRSVRASGLHGKATAIALSADSQFVFALTSGSNVESSEVCMIYLDWRSVFARQTLGVPAAGLAIVR